MIKNVLSLFDGISCGQLALQRAGIIYGNYYASEIYEPAIRITQHHFPSTVQLGDVHSVKGFDLPDISLLLAGSPCRDLSVANKKRTGLEGQKSSLFYEFYRLWQETQPQFFLFENVKMPLKDEQIITSLLGVEPLRFNSSLLTGQSRPRLYWTNIPCKQNIEDKNIELQSILENGYTDKKKSRCLMAGDSRPCSTPVKMYHRYVSTGFTTLIFRDYQHWLDCKQDYDLKYKGKPASVIVDPSSVYEGVRYLTTKERELLQTVPIGYTNLLTQNEAAHVLGDGWTVDVIAHIFRGLL